LPKDAAQALKCQKARKPDELVRPEAETMGRLSGQSGESATSRKIGSKVGDFCKNRWRRRDALIPKYMCERYSNPINRSTMPCGKIINFSRDNIRKGGIKIEIKANKGGHDVASFELQLQDDSTRFFGYSMPTTMR
jgi:hypothetical protein